MIVSFEIYDVATGTMVKPYQLQYTRTVVGWYNLRLNGFDGQLVTVPPAVFFARFPDVSRKARLGCADIDGDKVRTLGFTVGA